MVGGDVAEFVRQHPLEFCRGYGFIDKARVDVDDVLAGDEGVDGGISHHDEMDGRIGGQRAAQRVGERGAGLGEFLIQDDLLGGGWRGEETGCEK